MCYRLKIHQEDAKNNGDTDRLDFFIGLTGDHQAAQHGSVQLGMFDPDAIVKEFYLSSQIVPHTEEGVMALAKKSKAESMAKSERGIDPEFQRFAREILVETAAGNQFFTSDDIWQRMPSPFDRETYREPRHMGIVTSWGSREGYMKRTKKYVPTVSRKANMTLHTLWTSLVFEGDRINGG